MSGFIARPPGVLATIVGGVAGAVVVYLIGPPIADAVASDGLGGLGTALTVLFLLWCAGTGLGVAIALVARGHDRPLLTAMVAVPGMVLAVVVTFTAGSQLASDIVLWSIFAATSLIALWLARALTMLSGSPELREQ